VNISLQFAFAVTFNILSILTTFKALESPMKNRIQTESDRLMLPLDPLASIVPEPESLLRNEMDWSQMLMYSCASDRVKISALDRRVAREFRLLIAFIDRLSISCASSKTPHWFCFKSDAVSRKSAGQRGRDL
jgi:hypothetical protein